MIGPRARVGDGMHPVPRFRYRKRRSRTGPRRWIDRAVSAGWMARIFSLDVNNTVVPSTPLDLRLGEWDGGNLDVPRPPGTLGVRYRGNATGGKSSLTVAATDIGDAPKAPDPFNLRLNGRLLQCPHAAMEAARPGSRSRSTDVFVGGSRPARNAPPVKPSAQPFSQRPRSTDGVHIDQSGTNLELTWTCVRSSLLKPGSDDQGNYRRDRGRYPGKNLSRTGASSFRPCVRRLADASMAAAKPGIECPPLLGEFPTDSALFYNSPSASAPTGIAEPLPTELSGGRI